MRRVFPTLAVRDWGHTHIANQRRVRRNYRFGRAKANAGALYTVFQGAHGLYKLGKSAYNFFSSKNSKKRKNTMAPIKKRKRVKRDTVAAAGSKPKVMKMTKTRKPRMSKALVKASKPRKAQRGNTKGVDLQSFATKVPRAKGYDPIVKRIIKNGIQSTNEQGKKIDIDKPCAWLGHTTCPAETMRIFIWCAILKRLYVKAGLKINALNEPLNLSSTDKYTLWYQPTGTAAPITFSTTFLSAGPSLINQAAYFAATARPYNGAYWADNASVVFIQMKFTPTVFDATDAISNVATINLENSKVEMFIRSDLKIQNITVGEATDDQITSIDNVPLYMHTYGGHGNTFTTLTKKTGVQSFCLTGDSIAGIVYPLEADYQKEPVHPKELGAKEYKRAILQPGEIHQDTISYHHTAQINSLFAYLGADVGSKPKKHYGKIRVFAFDKMIETLAYDAPEERLPISLAYENNKYYAFQFKEGFSNVTTQMYSFNGVVESG